MKLKKISIPRAHQAVHEALQQAILSGSLAPGEQLPTEAELSEQFGVARHTVREGMRALEQGGMVKRDSARRLHVVIPSHDALASRASHTMLMQRVTCRELFEVAIYVETCAMELAMVHADDDLVRRLEANLADMADALERGRSIIALDVEFHALIAETAQNRVLLMAREPVSQLFYPLLHKLFHHPKTSEHSPRRLIAAHRHIVDAIKARNGAGAMLWMSRHMKDFRRGYDYAGLDIDTVADGK